MPQVPTKHRYKPPQTNADFCGRRWLLCGGSLLVLYAAPLLIAAVLTDFAPEVYHPAFKVGAITLPVITVLIGLFGILTAVKRSAAMAEIALMAGTRLLAAAAVLQAAVMLAAPEQIAPLYTSLGQLLPFVKPLTADPAGANYVLLPTVLGLCIHVWLTGLEANDFKGWGAYVIVRSVTRLIFIIVGPPIVQGMEPDFSIMTLAVFVAALALTVQMIRRRADEDASILKCIGYTVLAAVGFMALAIGFNLFGGLVGWVCDLWIGIPIIITVFMLLLLGPAEESERAAENKVKLVYGGPGYSGGTASGTFNGAKTSSGSYQSGGNESAERRRREEERQKEERRRKEEEIRKRSVCPKCGGYTSNPGNLCYNCFQKGYRN